MKGLNLGEMRNNSFPQGPFPHGLLRTIENPAHKQEITFQQRKYPTYVSFFTLGGNFLPCRWVVLVMRRKGKELILGKVCKGEVAIHYFWASLVTANSITAWYQKILLFLCYYLFHFSGVKRG